jgi:hypothetical protein
VSHSASAPEPDQDPRWRLTPTKVAVSLILLFAIITPLLVSTYDSVNPRLFGFPFFYWYQLAWVFLAAACCSICFFLLKREREAYDRAHPRTDEAGPRRSAGEQ